MFYTSMTTLPSGWPPAVMSKNTSVLAIVEHRLTKARKPFVMIMMLVDVTNHVRQLIKQNCSNCSNNDLDF